MAKRERIKLNLAINKLFPETAVTIGEGQDAHTVLIRPLSLEQWISIINKFNAFVDACTERNINLDVLFDKEKPVKSIDVDSNETEASATDVELVDDSTKTIKSEIKKKGRVILDVASLVIGEFPDLLEEVTNIDKDDLVQLPPDVIVNLIAAAIEVNLKSKDTLIKNYNRLTSLVNPKQEKKDKE